MLELASHIVETKAGHFEPEKFEDQYEDALKELLKKKQGWGEDRSALAPRAAGGRQRAGTSRAPVVRVRHAHDFSNAA
jgi:non-homologous end joining protein Ku